MWANGTSLDGCLGQHGRVWTKTGILPSSADLRLSSLSMSELASRCESESKILE